MQLWEYADLYYRVDKWVLRLRSERKEFVLEERKLVEIMSILGDEGWEFVQSVNFHYIFKRPK